LLHRVNTPFIAVEVRGVQFEKIGVLEEDAGEVGVLHRARYGLGRGTPGAIREAPVVFHLELLEEHRMKRRDGLDVAHQVGQLARVKTGGGLLLPPFGHRDFRAERQEELRDEMLEVREVTGFG